MHRLWMVIEAKGEDGLSQGENVKWEERDLRWKREPYHVEFTKTVDSYAEADELMKERKRATGESEL